MILVNIPAPMRSLTAGISEVPVTGSTLGEVLDGLEAAYPGIRTRFVDEEKFKRGIAVFLDGKQAEPHLSLKIPDGAKLFFAPAISGGLSL